MKSETHYYYEAATFSGSEAKCKEAPSSNVSAADFMNSVHHLL